VPLIDAKVKPLVSVSVTVTVPLVAGAVAWLDTNTVYAPDCPCMKLPV